MMLVVLCIPSGTMAGLLEFNQQKVYSKMVCLFVRTDFQYYLIHVMSLVVAREHLHSRAKVHYQKS